jgi:hypothetical protein
MFIVTFFAALGILLGFASFSSGLESEKSSLDKVTNSKFFRVTVYEDAACSIPKTEIDTPLDFCGPSAAHVREFLKIVLKKDEPKQLQYLTHQFYVDSQCTQLSTSTWNIATFSLLHATILFRLRIM